MLATSWRDPFSDDGWLFEPKWDGIRVILSFDGETTTLRSRRGNDITARFPELTAHDLDEPSVVDGEIVVLEEGVPSFERLQQRSGSYSATAAAAHPVACIAFDLLHVGDRSLVDEPIEDRLSMLRDLGLTEPFGVVAPTAGGGLDLWEVVQARDLEGMVAKRKGSRYRPGVRSEDWRKIHHINRVRAIVGGFTPGDGGRTATFGSLLVGMWEADRLRWAGAVGTGFSDSELAAIRAALDEQRIDHCPFHEEHGLPTDAVWVEPRLVAAIGFRNWTDAGRLRHPRFQGFTDDPPEAVTWEAEGP